MRSNVKKVLVSEQQIKEMVNKLGEQISLDYKGKDLIVIGVLKGGFIFLADLIRKITIPVEPDFMSVSSYGHSTKSCGVVKIIKDIDVPITNRHVLVVEDIVDTGLTLNHLKELLLTRNPASIKLCAALDKPSKRKVHIDVDYAGIVIPDEFVVGYGLDYKGLYRNLSDICVLDVETL